MFKNKPLLFLIILGVSSFTHFAFFGQPNQTVFDEVHFGKFVSGYLAGEYFFDIHPPLGKLLFSGIAYLGGFSPEFSFDNIGTIFPNNHYLALRSMPMLAGTLLPLVIFAVALQLGFSPAASFLAGILTALDGALITQSRFILLDAFLLLFGFSALLFYLKFLKQTGLNHGQFQYLWLAGIFGALAGSIKWTGFSFLGWIFFLEAWRNRFWLKHFREIFSPLFSLMFIPLLIYFAIFAMHFQLLPKSGPGDAFMSPGFQKTLLGNSHQKDPNIQPVGLLKKFTELNYQMYSANQRLTATHPYGSRWYTWPLLVKPIYFWNKSEPLPSGAVAERKIYLLGNPLIWWGSTVAILYLGLNLLVNKFKKKKGDGPVYWILGAYFLNLLPFIGVHRVMFLYHYFIPLLFAILGLSYLADKSKKPERTAVLLIISAVFLFLYFAPLTYGLPLTNQESMGFFWFSSWR